MIFRIMASAGLLALGYYVGREVGRTETIRDELERARARQGGPADEESGAAEGRSAPAEKS